jgi:hypothetical protein
MKSIEIGRLLRASTSGCVVGCKVSGFNTPSFGGMVTIPLDERFKVYGLIYDMHIDDDGLVRQLVTAEKLDAGVIDDNRINRNIPAEISVMFIGYLDGEKIIHRLPPHPPLSLDAIYPSADQEIMEFTSSGHFGYFRHILRALDLPIAEILSAHLAQVGEIHAKHNHPDWIKNATRELITLLRDDYATLNTVLNALADLDLYNGNSR